MDGLAHILTGRPSRDAYTCCVHHCPNCMNRNSLPQAAWAYFGIAHAKQFHVLYCGLLCWFLMAIIREARGKSAANALAQR